MGKDITAIEKLFELFASTAMNPKPYKPADTRKTVSVPVTPEVYEILNVIACRIGTTRAVVASHILKMGCVEAAAGAGFTVDENMRIPKTQKGSWDLTPKKYGIEHMTTKEEEEAN